MAATSSRREPSLITLGEIVSAVDGPITLGDFGEPHQDGACDHEGQCVLLAVWAGISGRIRQHLDSFTLADIAAMARGQADWPTPDLTRSHARQRSTSTAARSSGNGDSNTRVSPVVGWASSNRSACRNGRAMGSDWRSPP